MEGCTEYDAKTLPIKFKLDNAKLDNAVVNFGLNFTQRLIATLSSDQFKTDFIVAIRKSANEDFFVSLRGAESDKELLADRRRRVLKKFDRLTTAKAARSLSVDLIQKKKTNEISLFKDEMECSPSGIFVNQSKGEVLFLVTFGILASGILLYNIGKSDKLPKNFDLSKLSKTANLGGTIKLNTGVSQLVPSEKTLAGNVGIASGWETVNFDLNIRGATNKTSDTRNIDIKKEGSFTIVLPPYFDIKQKITQETQKTRGMGGRTERFVTNKLNTEVNFNFQRTSPAPPGGNNTPSTRNYSLTLARATNKLTEETTLSTSANILSLYNNGKNVLVGTVVGSESNFGATGRDFQIVSSSENGTNVFTGIYSEYGQGGDTTRVVIGNAAIGNYYTSYSRTDVTGLAPMHILNLDYLTEKFEIGTSFSRGSQEYSGDLYELYLNVKIKNKKFLLNVEARANNEGSRSVGATVEVLFPN